jgi:non-canonical (house-cleaning) NTP pyrophosphatase
MFGAKQINLNNVTEQVVRLVLASKSAIKVAAVTAAVTANDMLEISAVHAQSDVAEQPIGDETLLGAKNRIADAMKISPGADIYVAIENGIYEEGEHKIDKAVVLIRSKKSGDNHYTDTVHYSEGVEFPLASFNKAKQLGFKTTVVSKVMLEEGLVTSRDDPHVSLGKKIPRVKLLEDALIKAELNQLCLALLGSRRCMSPKVCNY